MNEYRVKRISGNLPMWRIEHDGSSDIALTEQDTMLVIGDWVQRDYEAGKGDEFLILWDNVPMGFRVPALETMFGDEPSRLH